MSSSGPVKALLGPAQVLIASVVGFGLVISGFIVPVLTPLHLVGLVMVVSGFALRIVLVVFRGVDRWRVLAHGPSAWWYNSKTQQTAEGRLAPGRGWDGPYVSQQDAARAPEIARARSAAWNAED